MGFKIRIKLEKEYKYISARYLNIKVLFILY